MGAVSADSPRPEPAPEDPSGIEGPHDTLAAEEFAMPAPPRETPPADPSGIEGPHDTLAAEAFAIGGGGVPAGPERSAASRAPLALVLLAASAVAVLWASRRRR